MPQNDVPLKQSWELLGRWAEVMSSVWETRREEMRHWTTVEYELANWAGEETSIWEHLAAVSSDPVSDALRGALKERIQECDGGAKFEAKLAQAPDPNGSGINGTDASLRALWMHVGNAAEQLERVWNARGAPSDLATAREWTDGALARWEELNAWAARPIESRPAGKFLVAVAQMTG